MNDGGIKINISADQMKARIALLRPEDGKEYSYNEVDSAIKSKHITYGINSDIIKKIIDEKLYNVEYEFATGTEKVDGVDGYFEYKFNTEFNQKPELNDDGSVNYKKLHLIETVEENQEIVEIHEPIEGQNGVTVTGKTVLAKPGRAMPALQGRGFILAPDKRHYIAERPGRIEKKNEKVFISDVYEISNDVDMKTGNIDFRGDVIIHGNVKSGMTINATGTITIDGIVEAATIKAGKDIIIRGGFIGGYKGCIETKMSLQVKFMEYGTVRADGLIRTDSILNCHVTCYDYIIMEGKHANIIGGYVYAACGIEVYTLGSEKGTQTKIVVGIEKMHLQQMIMLRGSIEEKKNLITKVDVTLEQLEKIAKIKNEDSSKDPKRLALLRTKIKTQSELKKCQLDLDNLENLKLRSNNATVMVVRNVYPGVSVTIGTEVANIKELISTVQFKIQNKKIVIYSMKS